MARPPRGAHPDELSFTEVQELVAAEVPDRDALRWRGRRVTHAELTRRTRALANALIFDRGLGAVTPRDQLEPWQAGQDFVGILLYNRPEFIEAMFGAFKARCVPYNINYRYGPTEIRELLATAPTSALIYEHCFADVVRELAPDLEAVLLIEVDGPDRPAGSGAVAYEALVDQSPTTTPANEPSPDDLYVVFTGGTTGKPKAVLWRQGDAYAGALGGPIRKPDDLRPYAELVKSRISVDAQAALPAPPFMHGGGQWMAMTYIFTGNTVVIPDVVDRLDAGDLFRTIEREHVEVILITGNAFGVPLLDELAARSYQLSALKVIVTGAVAMTADVKQGLMNALPGVRIAETMGATESGMHLRNVIGDAGSVTGGPLVFKPSSQSAVLDPERTAVVGPGHEGTGWLARCGSIPLGYLGDRSRTDSTFVTIDGVRYSVPGDRARLLSNGDLEFLGRDNVTINSGGEKVFAEEVEAAIAASPHVYDVVVTGRPHPRWGEEVVAVVSLRPGAQTTETELKNLARETLARYKVPKQIAFVERIPRSPVGKADYSWARAYAERLKENRGPPR